MENSKKVIMILSCTQKKRKKRCPAGEMYQGIVFRKAQSLAKIFPFKVFILSSKYGIIGNEDVISPYELEIDDMSPLMRGKAIENLTEILSIYKCPLLIILGEEYYSIIRNTIERYSKRFKVLRLKGKGIISYSYHLKKLIQFGEAYQEPVFQDIELGKRVSFERLFR